MTERQKEREAERERDRERNREREKQRDRERERERNREREKNRERKIERVLLICCYFVHSNYTNLCTAIRQLNTQEHTHMHTIRNNIIHYQ